MLRYLIQELEYLVQKTELILAIHFTYICAMIKQFIAILFLFAFTAQMFSKAVIVCSFYANQKYIATNLCENRTKPKSCCKGRCQLRKRLNKDTNEDKQSNERKASKESEVLSSKSFFYHISIPCSTELATAYHFSNDGKAIDRSYSIFRPPA